MPVNIPPRAKRRCGQLEVEMEASAVLGEDSLAVANKDRHLVGKVKEINQDNVFDLVFGFLFVIG